LEEILGGFLPTIKHSGGRYLEIEKEYVNPMQNERIKMRNHARNFSKLF